MKKPDLHDAVLSSYPDVVTLQGNEANKIIAYNINNQKVTIDPNVVILKLSTMLSEYQTFLLNKDEIKKISKNNIDGFFRYRNRW